MKQIISILWAVLIALAFSALLHASDVEIGSMGAALSAPHLSSTIIVSMIVMVPMLFCMRFYRHHGWKGYFMALALISIVLGTILGFNSTGGSNSQEVLFSILGMIGICLLVCGLGSLPNAYLGHQNTKK